MEKVMLTRTDTQIQSGYLEDTVQRTGIQGSEADIGYICAPGGRRDYKFTSNDWLQQFLLVILLYPIPETDPAHAKKSKMPSTNVHYYAS